jgi:hypothetical protein
MVEKMEIFDGRIIIYQKNILEKRDVIAART